MYLSRNDRKLVTNAVYYYFVIMKQLTLKLEIFVQGCESHGFEIDMKTALKGAEKSIHDSLKDNHL